MRLISILGLIAFQGCAGCSKPIALSLGHVPQGALLVQEQTLNARMTLVASGAELWLDLSGDSDAQRSKEVAWVRGTIPLTQLTWVDGSADQKRSVEKFELGGLDIAEWNEPTAPTDGPKQEPVAVAETDVAPPKAVELPPLEFSSNIRAVSLEVPVSYALHLNRTKSELRVEVVPATKRDDYSAEDVRVLRYSGAVGVDCWLIPEKGGHGSTTALGKEIHEPPGCSPLRPLVDNE